MLFLLQTSVCQSVLSECMLWAANLAGPGGPSSPELSNVHSKIIRCPFSKKCDILKHDCFTAELPSGCLSGMCSLKPFRSA